MSWLRTALDTKHAFIRSIAVRLAPVIAPGYLMWFTLLLALLPLLVLPHTTDDYTPTPASQFVRLAQQGHYAPYRCSQINVAATTSTLQRYLPEMGRIARHTNATLLTGNHVRIPFCVLYLEQNSLSQFMLNPRFLPATNAVQQRYDITSRSLCNSTAKSMQTPFVSAGELFWTSPENTPREQTFDGASALGVQTALFIMQGGDICGTLAV